jgi:TM2 domain-containing membrane protein YozV
MIPIICLVFLFYSQVFPQEDTPNFSDINSPLNIKKFADFLFCTEDYLRAALEYEKYLNSRFNDTVEFKIGLSYERINNFSKAIVWFKKIKSSSLYYNSAQDEFAASLFRTGDYYSLRNIYTANIQEMPSRVKKLHLFSYFFTGDKLPSRKDFLASFDFQEEGRINEFYIRKIKPEYKNVTAAAIISALIPGSGKIYSGQISDGIISAVATGVCAYLAYDNFRAKHNFRGWIFSGLTGFFYAGNIYGSVAAAQIYNAGVQFDFENDIKLYLNQKNYFAPDYDFCK